MLTETEDFDIRVIFLGEDENEKRKALNTLFNKCNKWVYNFIKSHFPLITHEDRMHLMQVSFMQLYDRFLTNEESLNDPICPLLISIVRKKCIDEVRKRRVRNRAVDEFFQDIADRLHGTKIGETWDLIIEKELTVKVQVIFRKLIPNLSKLQQYVARVMDDYFPDYLSLEEIKNEILVKFNESVVIGSVKSARSEIRKKFYKILKKELSDELRKHG